MDNSCPHHEAYVYLHPYRSGHVVCCSDCYKVSYGATRSEAVSNWKNGIREEEIFERSDLSNGLSIYATDEYA
jgi:hypothetical protein